jgi:CO/xanthine dehydrogenase Mo-binding subunit
VPADCIGGGFGNKVGIYPGYVCSIVTGRPVTWMEDRSENLMTTSFARDYHMSGEIAATHDGRILAVRVKTLADNNAFNSTAQRGQHGVRRRRARRPRPQVLEGENVLPVGPRPAVQ